MLTKGKPPSAPKPWTPKGTRVESPDPDAIAITLLGAIAQDSDRLGRFMALTGLAPDGLRDAARDPAFLAAVLDHVAADESLLVALAAEIGLKPETIGAAHARLAAPDPWDG